MSHTPTKSQIVTRRFYKHADIMVHNSLKNPTANIKYINHVHHETGTRDVLGVAEVQTVITHVYILQQSAVLTSKTRGQSWSQVAR